MDRMGTEYIDIGAPMHRHSSSHMAGTCILWPGNGHLCTKNTGDQNYHKV